MRVGMISVFMPVGAHIYVHDAVEGACACGCLYAYECLHGMHACIHMLVCLCMCLHSAPPDRPRVSIRVRMRSRPSLF